MRNIRFTVIFLLQIMCPITLSAQWQSANGPYGGMVWDMRNNEQTIFATQSNGVFRSINRGRAWTKCDTARVHHLTVNDQQVMLLSYDHYYIRRSNDGGNTWTTLFLPDSIRFVRDWAEKDSVILISANKNLWRSVDGGKSWYSKPIAGAIEHLYDAIEIINGWFYVSDRFNIYRSPDGLTWTALTAVPEPLPFVSVFQLYGHDTILLAFTGPNLFRSGDGGLSWMPATVPPGALGPLPPNFTRTASHWYAASGRLLVSDDAGASWLAAPGHSAAPADLWAIAQAADTILCGSQTTGVYQTNEEGIAFSPANRGLFGTMVFDVAAARDTVYAWDTRGISRSVAPIFVWDTVHLYQTQGLGTSFSDLKIHRHALFARQSGGDLLRSKDGGKTWEIASPPGLDLQGQTFRLESKNDTLFLLESVGKLWHTRDLGDVWQEALLPESIEDMAIQNHTVFIAADSKIYRSTNGATGWSLVGNSPGSGARLFAVRSFLLALIPGNSPQMFVSADEGQSWQLCAIAWPAAFQGPREQRGSVFQIGTVLVGSFERGGVFVSRDGGLHWVAFDTGLPTPNKIFELAANDQWLLAGTGEGLFYRMIGDLTELSIHEQLPDNQIIIYPNPVIGILNVKNRRVEHIQQFHILNGQGRAVLQNTPNNATEGNTYSISVPALLPGIYFLRMCWQDGVEKTIGFIKQ